MVVVFDKLGRLAFGIVLSALALDAQAFHSGGVAECEGCHSMHGESTSAEGTKFASGPYLLKARDQSGACLNCHEATDAAPNGYHVSTAGVRPYDSTAPVQATPGGDFAWLKKTMNVTVRGSTAIDGNQGERHGHSIVAVDFGYEADSTLKTAPGGTYPAASLHCSSCHDPHGKYRRDATGAIEKMGPPIVGSGSYNDSVDPIAGLTTVGAYRILGGAGYQPMSLEGSFAFANTVPSAVSPSSYNRHETSQAGQTFVAYGSGMSEWCANCHRGILQSGYTSGMAGLRHPAGNGAKLTGAIAANYNAYVRSGVMTNVAASSAYSTLTPFEIGGADYTVLKSKAALTGSVDRSASTAANVACVSCHRAHASAFGSLLRFSYQNEFMTVADASNGAAYDASTTENRINHGYDENQQIKAYNGRPASMFGPYARSQCNKCHAKD